MKRRNITIISVLLVMVVSFSIYYILKKDAFASGSVEWNTNDKGIAISLSNNDLTATTTADGWATTWVRATVSVATYSGKYYWEYHMDAVDSTHDIVVGVATADADLTGSVTTSELMYYGTSTYNGIISGCDGTSGGDGVISQGDVIGIALDMDTRKVKFYRNNTLVGGRDFNAPASGDLFPLFRSYYQGAQVTVNFGDSTFVYSPPEGYVAYSGAAPSPTPSPEPTVTPGSTATPEPTSTPELSPTPTPVPNGNRAILLIKMAEGIEKEFDLPMTEVDGFTAWYDERSQGTGKGYYVLNNNSNVAPFISRKEYVNYDKIINFEVKEYTAN